MITLKDVPGGMKFAERLAAAVDDLSLAFANTPDVGATLQLDEYLRRIAPGIIDAVGAGNAPMWLDAFRRAVMARKHEIEAAGPAPQSLNWKGN